MTSLLELVKLHPVGESERKFMVVSTKFGDHCFSVQKGERKAGDKKIAAGKKL